MKNYSPEELGLSILAVKDIKGISICEAADYVFAHLATRPSQAQNPQGAGESNPGPATPEAANGAHHGDGN